MAEPAVPQVIALLLPQTHSLEKWEKLSSQQFLPVSQKKHPIYREAANFFSSTMNKNSEPSFVPASLVCAEVDPLMIWQVAVPGTSAIPQSEQIWAKWRLLCCEVQLGEQGKSAADTNKTGSFKKYVQADFTWI